MKELYKSPLIAVEELKKSDVLCDSLTLDTPKENVSGAFETITEGGGCDFTTILQPPVGP